MVAVPLGFYLIRGIMIDSCHQESNVPEVDDADPTRWVCEEASAGIWTSFLAQSPLAVAWWCNCVGVLSTCLIMAGAIFVSDWAQISKDAQAELVAEEDAAGSVTGRTSAEKRALAHWTRSTMEDVLNSGPKLLGRTFSGKERDVLESGEHWVGSVAEDNQDDDSDSAAGTDRTWPKRGNRAGNRSADAAFRQTAPER